MIRRIILYLALISFLPLVSNAQEVITGLHFNPSLKKNADRHLVSRGITADTLSLPFFDDFSYESVFPDQDRWIDNYVFINNTYSVNQVSKGIATFDILDDRGYMYDVPAPSGFQADRLTSAPIDLRDPSYPDIWFSFMYEPGGLADAPEPADSLVLQFFAPEDSIWYSVWRTGGGIEHGFRNVIIPVDHPRYLKKGFRFRFMNYASLAKNIMDPSMTGNCDIWNIDYVLMDAGRTSADTLYADVAFTVPMRSVLKNYETMPWKHFSQAVYLEMGLTIPVSYRNNDTIKRNVTRNFEIRDVYENSTVHTFTAGADNADPGTVVDLEANLIYTFTSPQPDSALFRITSSLKTDDFDPKENDTLVYYQVFRNYLSYDDGSAEGGYGINGLGSRNAMFAHRYTSYISDTLRAIDICFNDSYMDANQRSFDIMVWNDINGMPGNVIYRREEVMVENGSVINGLSRYMIPGGVPVENDFYIGWKQRSETFLNAGYDINTPHEGRQFFWLNGAWSLSQVEGSVMIRPVMGSPIITGINNDVFVNNRVRIWPVPAGDYITVTIDDLPYYTSAYISVIDLSGHEIMRVPYSEVIDISRLKRGMYIMITVIDGKRTGINRVIKSR